MPCPSLQACYQCEQTLNRVSCTEVGVCGKTPEVAALQVREMNRISRTGSCNDSDASCPQCIS